MAVRTYNEWRAGSSAAGDEATSDYNSYNAQVYENGTLGPRPGWKEWTVNSEGWSAALDTSYGIATVFPEDDTPHIVWHYYDATTSLRHEAQSFSLNEASAIATGGTVHNLTGMSVGEYSKGKLNPSSFVDRGKPPTKSDGTRVTIGGFVAQAGATDIDTPALPSGASAISAATTYRERMYYWAEDAKPGRIYYSDAADYTTVGASSFFDISTDITIYPGAAIDMWSVKNALLIAAKGGKWFVLTGPSPENGTLRELGIDVVPNPVTACVVDNELYFLNPNAQGVVVATPSFVETRRYRYLSPTAYPGHDYTRPDPTFQPLEGVGDDQTGSIFLPGRLTGNSANVMAAERVNDTWTLSRWDYNVTTPEDFMFCVGRPNEIFAVCMESADHPLYSRNFTLNRPANTDDTHSLPLQTEDADLSNVSNEVVVRLGEIVAGDGALVRPTKVVLDIDYWKGGAFSAPELAIDAHIDGCVGDPATPYDDLTQQVVTTTSWGNSTGELPNSRRVAVALPQGQWGTRFYIQLTFDTIALDNVQVYYEEQKDPR